MRKPKKGGLLLQSKLKCLRVGFLGEGGGEVEEVGRGGAVE